MQVNLVVIPDELEDSDVKATSEGHSILCHANGVVLDVWTPGGRSPLTTVNELYLEFNLLLCVQ